MSQQAATYQAEITSITCPSSNNLVITVSADERFKEIRLTFDAWGTLSAYLDASTSDVFRLPPGDFLSVTYSDDRENVCFLTSGGEVWLLQPDIELGQWSSHVQLLKHGSDAQNIEGHPANFNWSICDSPEDQMLQVRDVCARLYALEAAAEEIKKESEGARKKLKALLAWYQPAEGTREYFYTYRRVELRSKAHQLGMGNKECTDATSQQLIDFIMAAQAKKVEENHKGDQKAGSALSKPQKGKRVKK